jgi:hypothetical protein
MRPSLLLVVGVEVVLDPSSTNLKQTMEEVLYGFCLLLGGSKRGHRDPDGPDSRW